MIEASVIVDQTEWFGEKYYNKAKGLDRPYEFNVFILTTVSH